MHRSFSSLYRLVTCFLVMTVLTSGIAMAAYACPPLDQPVKAVELAMEGQPCLDMDAEKPVQCAEYQSPSRLALKHLAVSPALTPVVIAAIQPASMPVVLATPSVALGKPDLALGADPPYLRTLRLRI